MTFFSIYSTDSLDFVDKEINYKSGDYLKGTKQRNLSCPLHARWCIRKTVLKVQTADWKIAWYLKKKNYIITWRVKLSLPQNGQLLYPVQWLMKN